MDTDTADKVRELERDQADMASRQTDADGEIQGLRERLAGLEARIARLEAAPPPRRD